MKVRWTYRSIPQCFRSGVASCGPPRRAIPIRDTGESLRRRKTMSLGWCPLPGAPNGAGGGGGTSGVNRRGRIHDEGRGMARRAVRIPCV